jgi:hypothetical protein
MPSVDLDSSVGRPLLAHPFEAVEFVLAQKRFGRPLRLEPGAVAMFTRFTTEHAIALTNGAAVSGHDLSQQQISRVFNAEPCSKSSAGRAHALDRSPHRNPVNPERGGDARDAPRMHGAKREYLVGFLPNSAPKFSPKRASHYPMRDYVAPKRCKCLIIQKKHFQSSRFHHHFRRGRL